MARPRPLAWLLARPVLADVVLAGVVTTVAVVAHLTLRDPDYADPSLLGTLLTVAATAPIALRRRWPTSVFLFVLVAQAACEAAVVIGANWAGVMVAAYTFGTLVTGRRLWVVGVSSVVGVAAFVVLGVLVADVPWQSILGTPAVVTIALLVGHNMRRRRERQDELMERAERAERERELLAQQRVQHERTRIARELHDVVAHSVSVMVIQAAAARRTSDIDAARAAMETVETTGRRAMAEMRRVLGVLRDDEAQASVAPQPSLAELRALVDEAGDLPVRLDTVGGDGDQLPAGVELSVYRIVQEGLTNVRRHAGTVTEVLVGVHRQPGSVVVEVSDDGNGAGATSDGDGLGLTGMRERVAMHDGTLSVGPRPGGGWRVRAVIPVGA